MPAAKVSGLCSVTWNFAGQTWQERWEASGLNDEGCGPVRELFTGKAAQNRATGGLKALVCARVIHPSLSGLRANRLRHFPIMFRQAQRDEQLDAFFAAVAACRASQRNQYAALFDVCCALATQAIALADLTPEALLYYAEECARLGLVLDSPGDTSRRAGLLAWEVLTTMGHFPPGTPPTLRGYRYRGQRSTQEMVDFYQVTDPGIRQLFIDYLTRRDADLDYTSCWNLASMLVGIFWQQVQRIAPDQRDLRLSPEV